MGEPKPSTTGFGIVFGAQSASWPGLHWMVRLAPCSVQSIEL